MTATEATTARTAIEAPAESGPCAACPWLAVNHGKRHPDGWYTASNRRRLWGGMRTGELMTCHPTDPDNPAPSDRPDAKAPEGKPTRLCAGAWALVAIELNATSEALGPDGGGWSAYTEARPHPPLTKDGAAEHAMRLVGWPGQVRMPTTLTWDVTTVAVNVARR